MSRLVAFVVLLPLALLGCRGNLPSTVSGQVTLDGEPLSSGDVQFHRTGGGAPATGSISANGQYTLSTGTRSGLEEGDYTATVVAVGEPPADDVPPPVLTPPRYGRVDTSDLKVTVGPGANTIDLPLKTKP